MLKQLEADKLERFGGKLPSQQEKKGPTPLETVDNGIKTVKTLYTDFRAPGVAKTCLKTCCTFISNVLKDPSNEKFRKVNLENEAVQKRVAKINGGLKILRAAGYEDAPDGSHLFMPNVDEALLKQIVDKLKPNFED